MFRAKTLLVLGAGASLEVGLPTGETLLKQISDLIDFRFEFGDRLTSGDQLLLQTLKIILNEGREVKNLNAHLAAGQQLRKSAQQALSIDNVIDALEDKKVELVGKLGILRAILKAESESQFFRPQQEHRDVVDVQNFGSTWYSSFTKLLTENIRKSEVDRLFENIEIINFNYDRCLERYLPQSISDYYGISLQEAEALMTKLRVHRPYGLCGRLPWMQGQGPIIQFGQENSNLLGAAVSQIRTFTEQIDEGDEIDAIRSAIGNADRIIFLGFAFHRQNMSLLSSPIQDHTEIIATAYGISSDDIAVIERESARVFDFEEDSYSVSNRINLRGIKCAGLFKQHWRTITSEAKEV
ncbi:hypothetical protein [Caulobacter vibrioides]|uniref:hypothetical protein n=1 Tax=Caulobacter vibrioides TaxID=155892 RepID=UPI0015E68B45|nr:hypothetical protein [Caulobacter vibrioides]